MMDFRVKRYNACSDDELVKALRTHAQAAGARFVAARQLTEATGTSEATISRRFGSWAAFCRMAGIEPRYGRTADRQRLPENLGRVWESLGRQPRAKEMKQPLSPISVSRYEKVFGANWYQVCLEFLAWKSGTSASEIAYRDGIL